MKIYLPIFILILLAGCSSTPEMSDELKAELYAPIICEEPDCKLLWERAMFYVSNNAGFKMQIANDSLIETFNPTDYSVKLAYRIQKQPLGGGKYKILTSAWCANLFGCHPDQYEAILKAKRYIRSGIY